METLPVQNAFLDQEVGAAGGELDVGSAHHRATVQVRRDLHVVGLGHRCDFFAFQNATHAAQVHLQNGGGAFFKHAHKFPLGGQALAAGHRNGGAARDLAHFALVVWRNGLFKPQWVVFFQAAGQADGAGRRHLPMGAKQQVGLGAHGFAQHAAKGFRPVEFGE